MGAPLPTSTRTLLKLCRVQVARAGSGRRAGRGGAYATSLASLAHGQPAPFLHHARLPQPAVLPFPCHSLLVSLCTISDE
ncbi:hypothetical protein PENSPDRAFT_651701 [Peniophora sp. CONT]|nr:hypothetical protein PENSPDRAFT_651701 [Peniophora sp. CONT]